MEPRDPRSDPDPQEPVPLAQRLFDSPFLLLIVCLVVFFAFYTGWGWFELATLPPAPLP